MNQRLKIIIPYQNEQQEALSYILNACVTKTKDFSKKNTMKIFPCTLFSQKYNKNIFALAYLCGGKRKKWDLIPQKDTRVSCMCLFLAKLWNSDKLLLFPKRPCTCQRSIQNILKLSQSGRSCLYKEHKTSVDMPWAPVQHKQAWVNWLSTMGKIRSCY